MTQNINRLFRILQNTHAGCLPSATASARSRRWITEQLDASHHGRACSQTQAARSPLLARPQKNASPVAGDPIPARARHDRRLEGAKHQDLGSREVEPTSASSRGTCKPIADGLSRCGAGHHKLEWYQFTGPRQIAQLPRLGQSLPLGAATGRAVRRTTPNRFVIRRFRCAKCAGSPAQVSLSHNTILTRADWFQLETNGIEQIRLFGCKKCSHEAAKRAPRGYKTRAI